MENIKKTKETLTTESFSQEFIKHVEKSLDKISKGLKVELKSLSEEKRAESYEQSQKNWSEFVSEIQNPLLRIRINKQQSETLLKIVKELKYTGDKEISTIVKIKPQLVEILDKGKDTKIDLQLDYRLDVIAPIYYFLATFAVCDYDSAELYESVLGVFQKPLADFNTFMNVIEPLSKEVTKHYFIDNDNTPAEATLSQN